MREAGMRQVTLVGTRGTPAEHPTRGGLPTGPGSRAPPRPPRAAPLTVRLLHGALVQPLVVGQRGDVSRGQQLRPRPVEPGLLPRQHHGEAPGLCAGGGRAAPLRRRAEPGAGTAGTARPHGGAGRRPCSGRAGLLSLCLWCRWCPLVCLVLCQPCPCCMLSRVSGAARSAVSPVSAVPCPLCQW